MENLGKDVTPTPFGNYHYTTLLGNPVCIIIPRGLKPDEKTILFHFHGHRIAEWDSTYKKTIEHFNFAHILSESRPLVMICPLAQKGRGGYDLGYKWGTVHRIIPALQELGIEYDDVIISGHSAGYGPIGKILDGGTGKLPVSKVFLFDALYNDFNEMAFKSFLKVKSHKLWAVARDGNVLRNSLRLKAPNSTIIKSETSDHWKTVTMYMGQFLQESL